MKNNLTWQQQEDGTLEVTKLGFNYELKKEGFRHDDGVWHGAYRISICFGGLSPYKEQIYSDSLYTLKAAKKACQIHHDAISKALEEKDKLIEECEKALKTCATLETYKFFKDDKSFDNELVEEARSSIAKHKGQSK